MKLLLVMEPLSPFAMEYVALCEGLISISEEEKHELKSSCSHCPPGHENLLTDKYVLSGQELYDYSEQADLIFYITWYDYGHVNLPPTENDPPKVTGLCPNWISKAIYIDATENSWLSSINTPLRHILRQEPFVWTYMQKNCKLHAKRESYPVDIFNGCVPYPLGPMKSLFNPRKEKVYDVFCHFGQIGNLGLRQGCLHVAEFLRRDGYSVFTCDRRLPTEEYVERMNQSLIVVDSCGAGQNNIRLWEGVTGHCVVFRQKYNIVVDHDYIDGEEIVEYTNTEELYQLIKDYLRDKNKLARMAEKAYQKTVDYHHPTARIKYLLKLADPEFKKEIDSKVKAVQESTTDEEKQRLMLRDIFSFRLD